MMGKFFRFFFDRGIYLVGALCLSAPAWGTPIAIGAIATESGVPIAGQEDVVIFNFTGPVDGCATVAGTPICTSLTFQNVVLNINGTDLVQLGDLGPGMTESFSFVGGTYTDGAISSLAISATLSQTDLVNDLSNTYVVDANLTLSGLPVDGSFSEIDASPAAVIGLVPEPPSLPLGGLLLSIAATVGWARTRRCRTAR